jgi:hypothetical protein
MNDQMEYQSPPFIQLDSFHNNRLDPFNQGDFGTSISQILEDNQEVVD